MNGNKLKSLLHEHGELIVTVEEVPEPVELHKSDTDIRGGRVEVTLEDGGIIFEADRVTSATYHTSSTEDLGLE